MKFYLLPIGEQFTYQDINYTKSGPLTASSDVNGENKMIPRSANIIAHSSIAEEQKTNLNNKQIPDSEVFDAINIFYTDVSDHFKNLKPQLNDEAYTNGMLQIEAIYKKVLKQLSLTSL